VPDYLLKLFLGEEDMTLVRSLPLLFASFFICQPFAMAEALTVKVLPRSGEPMILSNFTMDWNSDTLDAVWNQQEIEIPIENIKSIKCSGAKVPEGDNADVLDVEVALKTGEKSQMKMNNFECRGESQFGKMQLDLADIELLEFESGLNRPDTNRPPAAPSGNGGGGPPAAGKP
jgi:hypothetical protein